MLRNCDLIIFDCDGVLVDTEPLTTRLVAEVVTEAGWAIDQSYAIEHFKGRPLTYLCDRVGERVGRPVPELAEIFRQRMYTEMESGAIAAMEGAAELLDALDSLPTPVAKCVASNGPRRKLEISLIGAGLADRFGGMESACIFSAYDMGCFKPDPGLFLHAARSFGAEPCRCVVIEDSESGIEAARAAGMRVIGVAGLTPAGNLRRLGADPVVDSVSELIDLVRSEAE